MQPPHYSRSCKAPPYDQHVENPLADIENIDEITDPAERVREIGRRLNAIPPWNTFLREKRQAAVLEMRQAGLSYAEIARETGLHRNRVQQIAEGRSGGAARKEAATDE